MVGQFWSVFRYKGLLYRFIPSLIGIVFLNIIQKSSGQTFIPPPNQGMQTSIGKWGEIRDNPSIALPVFTAECWVKVQSGGLIVTRDHPSGAPSDWQLWHDIANNRLAFITAATPPDQYFFSPVPVIPGRWLHIALVVNGPAGKARLYQDGSLALSVSFTPRQFNSQTGLAWGGYYNNSVGAYLNGQFDECRYWNYERTENQIRAAKDFTLALNDRYGLMGYWMFCGNWADSSGNGNHMTPRNNPLIVDIPDLPVGIGCDAPQQGTSNIVASPLHFPSKPCQDSFPKDSAIWISNTGNKNLTLTSASITGVDSFDFSLKSPPSIPPPILIRSGDSTAIIIRFVPNGLGNRTAFLEIRSDASNSPFLAVPLTGRKDSIKLLVSVVDYGALMPGDFPKDTTILIRNASTLPISLYSASFKGSSVFEVLSGLPAFIQPGAWTTIRVRFNDPGQQGTYTDSLIFSYTPSCAFLATYIVGKKVVGAAIDGPSQMNMAIRLCEKGPRDTVITIRNLSAGELRIINAAIEGDASFSIYPSLILPLVVPSGKSITIGIRFNPASSGDKVANLAITSNAINSPLFSIPLSGRKEAVEIQATTLIFGILKTSQLPTNRILTIQNSGSIAMTIDSASFTAGSPFRIISGLPATIPPGGMAQLQVRFFDPGYDGNFTDTLFVYHTPFCEISRILVTGTRISTAMIAGPQTFEYGLILCELGAKDTIITITNTGESDLIVKSATISGDPDFAFLSSLPRQIAPGKSDTLTVRFSPMSPGTKSATLVLSSNATNAPTFSILLTGKLDISKLSALKLDFGDAKAGSFPKSRFLAIQNTGTIPITIDSAVFQNGFPFRVTSGIPVTITAGGLAQIPIRFDDPLINSLFIDTLTIYHSPQCVKLVALVSGSRSSPPRIDALQDVLFTDLTCDEIKRDTIIIIQNSGGTDLILNNAVISGDPDFSLQPVPLLPKTIKPGAIDTLHIRFHPQTPGEKSALLVITSNAGNAPTMSIQLTGRKDSIKLIASNLDFGAIKPAEFPTTETLTITNTGSVAITLTSVSFDCGGPFEILTPLPLIISAGTIALLQVRFNLPPVDGEYRNTLTIEHNPSCFPLQCEIVGICQTRPGISAQTSLFYSQLLCETGPVDTVITINNTGGMDLVISDAIISGDPDFAFLTPFSPFTIPPNASGLIGVRFFPLTPGEKNATLTIYNNAENDSILNITLSGRKDIVSLAVSPLDFGTLFSSDFPKTGTIKICTNGTIPITLTEALLTPPGPFEVVSGIPAVISPGASTEITIRFTKPPQDGTYNSEVSLRFTPQCDGIFTRVTGTKLTIEVILEAGVVQGAPGEVVDIPIYLRIAQKVALAGVTNFQTIFRYNRTLLKPLFNTPRTTKEDDCLLTLSLPATPLQNGTIAVLPFLAALGNDTTTQLILENTKPIGGDVSVSEIPGRFTLTNVCREGGTRLFNASGQISLKQNRPNPFNPLTEIEYEVIESGRTRLFVTDRIGRTVAVLVDDDITAGRYIVVFNASSLPSGIYHYFLQTPSQIRSKSMLVVK